MFDESDNGTYVQVRYKNRWAAVKFEPSYTVAQLKKNIELTFGVPAANMHLFFGGTILQDNETIVKYGLSEATSLLIGIKSTEEIAAQEAARQESERQEREAIEDAWRRGQDLRLEAMISRENAWREKLANEFSPSVLIYATPQLVPTGLPHVPASQQEIIGQSTICTPSTALDIESVRCELRELSGATFRLMERMEQLRKTLERDA